MEQSSKEQQQRLSGCCCTIKTYASDEKMEKFVSEIQDEIQIISLFSVHTENTGSLHLCSVMKYLNRMLIFVFKLLKSSDALNM